MNDSTPGVLLLSHCGYSFLEDLIGELRNRKLKCFVLSSLPLPEHVPQRLEQLNGQVDRLGSTQRHELQRADVDDFIDSLHHAGEKVVACISVWEGYRHLMAYANRRLGVQDLAWDHALGLRNKLAVRNRLADAGLSAVRAVELTPVRLAQLKLDDRRYFIKPIHGIASYAAFPLRGDTQWQALQNMRRAARQDTVYASAFNGELTFMAEGYLAGQEFSFEVIMLAGEAYVVAIHEKCEVTEAADTVLENCCASPPPSLDTEQAAAGIDWIARLADTLHLDWGCYHIEARFTAHGWDLIEVNPRLGGALISHSVKAMTEGHSLVSLWLDLLLYGSGADADTRQAFETYLAKIAYRSDGVCPSELSTFFRVYFAEPGRLESVELKKLSLEHSVAHVLLKAGDEVEAQTREVFLGQVMWQYAVADQARNLALLAEQSHHAIEVRYARSKTREHTSAASAQPLTLA